MPGALRSLARQAVVYADAARTSGLFGALRPAAVARYVLGTLGRGSNPSGVITLHALNAPDREALVAGARRFSYRELDERIDRAARVFARLEARPGSRIAVMLRNCHEYLETQMATTRLGATVVQIGYRLKAPEVAYILGHSAPAVLVCGPGEEAVAREAAAQSQVPVRLIVVGAEYEELLAHADLRAPLPSRRRDDSGGLMIYTSGTTGRPKGAARELKKSLHESVADLARKLGLHHDDRHLCVAPLYHSAAPAFVAFTIAVGGTIVLMEHFDAEPALELLRRERVTSTMMVPTMLARLVAALDGRPAPPGMRWIASGAAPLPTETARRVEAAFGPVLYNFYGATETGLVSLALPGEHTARPGTIGRPLSGNEIKLLDEDGREVAPGAVGELYVRSSMLVGGYHGDRAATQKAMKDGFFSVGDMARVDADGYLYLADRKTDMVISGGVNIYPLEIEQRLHEHPAVADAAVIGVPDAEWGESLKAFIVLRAGQTVTAEELRAFCQETLANFKAPKHFAFVAALPRNPTGKVLKRELRET
jgi:fatty-acyl-CoA synthase